MGLSSSKSTTKPVYEGQILGAQSSAENAFNAGQPGVQKASNTITGLGNSFADNYYKGDPTLKAAQGYATDVLGGQYLNQGNPQLQAMIDQTNGDVANGVNAHLGTRGLTGGSGQEQLLARELARNETGLRYQNYGAERDRMGQAAGLAPSLMAAQYAPASAAIGALQSGAMMPMQSADQYAQTVGGLLGNYTNTKQTQSIGGLLAQMGGAALSGWASGGFKT